MFSSKQRGALILFIFLIATGFYVRWSWAQWYRPNTALEFVRSHTIQQSLKSNTTQPIVWDTFNPNTISVEGLMQLGLNEKTAYRIEHYRQKGGLFRSPREVFKIYGIDSDWVQKAQPFMIINSIKPQGLFKEYPEARVKNVTKTQNKIELNTADSLALLSIRGIGPVFAHRILKYRFLLGGFASVNQLMEVYGWDTEKQNAVQNAVYVNSQYIVKINLNTADFKTVNRHPYISYELTKRIFDWKRKTILTLENTREIVNDPVLWIKLLPYLQF